MGSASTTKVLTSIILVVAALALLNAVSYLGKSMRVAAYVGVFALLALAVANNAIHARRVLKDVRR